MNLKKAIFLTILASVIATGTRIFLCYSAESYQAAVEDLSQNKYLPGVKEALRNAKSSIDMVMFFVNFDPSAKRSTANLLAGELINAHKRGVKVKVILDQNIDFTLWNEGGEWQKQDKNDPFYQ
ncbi:MAG: phospholipase D-like domain-containing protein [Candidatus Omnitrophica bacterium]|nr:phospholipase D-like domain-containing protein [Candidatus Omnitrophota bacterium]